MPTPCEKDVDGTDRVQSVGEPLRLLEARLRRRNYKDVAHAHCTRVLRSASTRTTWTWCASASIGSKPAWGKTA